MRFIDRYCLLGGLGGGLYSYDTKMDLAEADYETVAFFLKFDQDR